MNGMAPIITRRNLGAVVGVLVREATGDGHRGFEHADDEKGRDLGAAARELLPGLDVVASGGLGARRLAAC